MKLGVLLFNLGGPETLADVRPFLFNLFSDPEIVRLPIRAMQKPLAWLISTARHKKSSGYYAQIGGGSPLRRITEEQAAALRGELARRGVEASVYVGMRYWRPGADEAVDQIVRDGVDELILLPLYPQFSVSTTGSSFKDFDALMERRNGLRRMRRHYIAQWHTHETYIEALTRQIAGEIEKFSSPTRVAYTFSLARTASRKVISKTATLISNTLKRQFDWFLRSLAVSAPFISASRAR
jgi:ferrochelatase